MATASSFGGDRAQALPVVRLNTAFGTTAMGASATRKVRLYTRGLKSITFRVMGAVTGTVTLDIYPMLQNATDDDTIGTRATTGRPSQVTLTNNTEGIIEYTLKGESYVEVEVATAAASDFTVTHLDAFAIPLLG